MHVFFSKVVRENIKNKRIKDNSPDQSNNFDNESVDSWEKSTFLASFQYSD